MDIIIVFTNIRAVACWHHELVLVEKAAVTCRFVILTRIADHVAGELQWSWLPACFKGIAVSYTIAPVSFNEA